MKFTVIRAGSLPAAASEGWGGLCKNPLWANVGCVDVETFQLIPTIGFFCFLYKMLLSQGSAVAPFIYTLF